MKRSRRVLGGFFTLLLLSLTSYGQFNHQTHQTSIQAPGKEYKRNIIFKSFFGFHYRKVWTTPISAQVLNLEEAGLTPIKQGGSRETLSLHLKDNTGKTYVARSVNKDLTKALPEKLQNTFLSKIMKDQVSANFPYAPLVVEPLMEKAGILHAKPQLYVIDSFGLGKYNQFAGLMVMLEERPDKSWITNPRFKSFKKILNTEELMKKRYSKGLNINGKEYLKCRLLDMFIGDWSRHEGQYNWILVDNQYLPIPKDRDHAFYKFNDGLLNRIAVLIHPRYKSFTKNIRGIKALTETGQCMDEMILTSLTKDEWKSVTDSLIATLDDQTIDSAVTELPIEIQKDHAGLLSSLLKNRRDDLSEASDKFYERTFKNPQVAGTDKSDLFLITRVNENETSVQIFRNDVKEEKEELFSRSFYTNETKEIKILGMEGDDEFQLFGNTRKGIKITLIGGPGQNTITEYPTDKDIKKKNMVQSTFSALATSQVVFKLKVK